MSSYPYPFEITILGAGSALPVKHHLPSSQYLRINNDRILIDCGECTQFSLVKNNISIYKIDSIFISHLHGDHFFGLPGLLSTLNLMNREKPLKIFGPKSLEHFIDSILNHNSRTFSYEIEFITPECDGAVFEIYVGEKITVSAFPLEHNIECYGYLVEEKPIERKLLIDLLDTSNIDLPDLKKLKRGENIKGKDESIIDYEKYTLPSPERRRYAYCSDTKYLPHMSDFFQEVDLLYHEATFLELDRERAQTTFHSTAADAARVAKETKSKKLLIGHLSSKLFSPFQSLKETQAEFKNTEIAKEYQKITL